MLVALCTQPSPAQAQVASFRAPSAPCSEGHVALTFDDGPSPSVTPTLLATLRRLRVPATFFMVGERVAAAPAMARTVERSGFLIANHTYHHEDLHVLSRDQIIATIRDTDIALHGAGVHPTMLVRPPYGSVDAHVYAAIKATHLRPVLWDVDPRDWESGNAAQIASRILDHLRPGDQIVLQHDGVANSPSSVAAVPRVVHEARRRGFCFVGLDEHGRPGFPTPHARLSAARTVIEGHRLTVKVTLDAMAGRDTSVKVSVRDGGSELGRFDEVLQVPAGSLTGRVRIRVRDDQIDEPTRTLTISARRRSGVRVDGSSITVKVKDDDPLPTVAGQPAVVVEPLTSNVVVPVTFALDHASSHAVGLAVQTVPGTADTTDFTPVATTLTIPAGATSVQLPVTVHADAVPEGPETFAVRIVTASGAHVGAADAMVTINPPTP